MRKHLRQFRRRNVWVRLLIGLPVILPLALIAYIGEQADSLIWLWHGWLGKHFPL